MPILKSFKNRLRNWFRGEKGVQFLAFIGSSYIKFVYKTTQWSYKGLDLLEQEFSKDHPIIICFWHGKLAMMPMGWIWKTPFAMLLSRHGDGRLIGEILKRCGSFFQTIEGSTQRHGFEAGRSILKILNQKIPVGITPDGPRGPRHKVSPGIVTLSYLSQAVIIPATYHISRRQILSSWDQFWVPLPFSKGAYRVGRPISPPASREEFEEVRLKIEQGLMELEEQEIHQK